MSGGPEPELPRWALRQERRKRPTWVVVLAVAMMAFGGHLLMSSMSIVRGLSARAPAAEVADAEALAKDVRAMSRALDRTHPVALRLNLASKVVLALLLLFAVAAVLSFDARGRVATLVAAWAGIAYHIGDALFLFLVVRKGVIAAAPTLIALAAQNGETPAPTLEDLVSVANTFMAVVSVLTAVVGISFSAVLLAYFGGRKGRLFYGLEQPQHGS